MSATPFPPPIESEPQAPTAARKVPWLCIVLLIVVLVAIAAAVFAIPHYNDEAKTARSEKRTAEGDRDRARDERKDAASERTAAQQRLVQARAKAVKVKAAAARVDAAAAAVATALREQTALDTQAGAYSLANNISGYDNTISRQDELEQKVQAALDELAKAENSLSALTSSPTSSTTA